MEINFKLKRVKNKEGVHTCIIVNAQTGVPLIYENLYLSIISRSNNYSYSTIEAIAGALLYFSRYLHLKGVGLVDKDKGNDIITGNFVYDLMTYLSIKKSKSNVINIKSKRVVSENCLHFKLTSIEKYLVWYYINIENENLEYIKLMSRLFKDIKPKIKKIEVYTDCEEKSLDKQQISTLMEIIKINSIKNPFKECVRIRNELIIDILLETGIRGGELLNLRIDDVNIKKCEIHIVRRPDSIEDTRIRQPLVKTLGRKIPISKDLSEKIQKYIDTLKSGKAKFNSRKSVFRF
ncbi:tyrosine-type recombinase/integrase [Erwinia amylovora]|uniref:tyrosine-type recombinase/integrase n=1 Tax=Erwinia amylovora TaxID=552 RepID=UPI001443A0EF|nr:tyrosine-type recombinase/integrase [Erwinia amylovora]